MVPLILIPAVIAGLIVLVMILAASWRVVVPANEVHIVQRNKTSTAYGSGMEPGNVYWKFPYWIPVIGTSVSKQPLAIFQIDLDEYEAYDLEKVPFAVDVISFFQIEEPIEVAKRASDGAALKDQLHNVLRGSVRKVLSSLEINAIMSTRSALNAEFLAEVTYQVKAWGVKVLSIEFVDIHDAPDTHVITDIMNRKKSKIEKESRMEVAENMRDATVKEIDSKQIAEVRAVEAQQMVEVRNTERGRLVGIAQQKANQEIKEEEQKTQEKMIAVQRTAVVGQANYEKEKKVVEMEAVADSRIIESKGAAESQKIAAEGYKSAQLLKAEGDAKLINETGSAEADVIEKKAVAVATGQLKQAEALAKIQKEGLQAQLGEKAILAHQAIGVAMAAAYGNADIKAILTQGGGIDSLGDLLSAPGGAKLGSFIDAIKKVTGGENVLEALGMKNLVPKAKPVEDNGTPAK